jgi:hypothetical protein
VWRRTLPEGACATLEEGRKGSRLATIRIDVERGNRFVQVNAWHTGAVDVYTADVASGQEVAATHREIGTKAEVLQLLSDIRTYVEGGG